MKHTLFFLFILLMGCNQKSTNITMTAPNIPADEEKLVLLSSDNVLLSVLKLSNDQSLPALQKILETHPNLNELIAHPFLKDRKVTLFIAAIFLGSLEEVELILTENPTLNLTDSSGHTALSHAIMLGRTDIVELLLRFDNNGDLVGPVNEIPLPVLAIKVADIKRSKEIILLLQKAHAPQEGPSPTNNYILPVYLQAERIGQLGIDFTNDPEDLKKEVVNSIHLAIKKMGYLALKVDYPKIHPLAPLNYLQLKICRHAPGLEAILNEFELNCSPK